jgi:hypothetical protein
MIDKEYVLDKWAAGASAGALAKELGCSRGGVRKIITLAKATGDPRAISHDLVDNRSPDYVPKTRAHYTELERRKRTRRYL